MNKEQNFEELAKNHPDLMKKARQTYLGVGDGWFHIIDVLCAGISQRVQQARYQLNYALTSENKKYAKSIPEAEAELAAAIDELPVIDQIKEKFGGLRFYVSGGTAKMDNYIEFAQQMSYRTCEVCGSPGEARNDGWVKTLCDKHHRERQTEQEAQFPSRKKAEPKLSDE